MIRCRKIRKKIFWYLIKIVGVFKLKEKFKKLKKAVDNLIDMRYTKYRSDEHKTIKYI